MGVLYDVLFKPIRRDGGGSAAADDGDPQPQPEWVLDRRDGGPLVWRRDRAAGGTGKRVEFLDAVQVREFERDECSNDDDDDDDDDEWFRCSADDGFGAQLSEAWADKDDYPVLVAVSVTMLGVCIGLAYLFAPVRWLLHHVLLVDD